MIDGYTGNIAVRAALQLIPLLCLRPSDLHRCTWAGLDFERSEWHILGSTQRSNLIVPLSRQAADILRDLRPIAGHSNFVFSGVSSEHRPMCGFALNSALRKIGIPREEVTAHGLRFMAKSLMNSELGIRFDLIEHKIPHSATDSDCQEKMRNSYCAQRHDMMQKWANYLDHLKMNSPDH